MMKLLTAGAFALVLTGSMAGAQTTSTSYCDPVGGCVQGGGKVVVSTAQPGADGKLSVYLNERITVTIPARVAMHLHETSWTVDLNNLENCECYRMGNHNWQTGRDEAYDLKAIMERTASIWSGDGRKIDGNPYSFVGDLNLAYNSSENHGGIKVTSYPGIKYDNATGKIEWKGPMACFNKKIVEKFANTRDWKVDIRATNTSANFPKLVLGDRLPNGKKFVSQLTGSGAAPISFTNTQAGYGGQTTGGWLDDYILEALVFDGSEVAGTHTTDVEFKLTGTF